MKKYIQQEIEKLLDKKIELASKLNKTLAKEEREIIEKEIELLDEQIKVLQNLL